MTKAEHTKTECAMNANEVIRQFQAEFPTLELHIRLAASTSASAKKVRVSTTVGLRKLEVWIYGHSIEELVSRLQQKLRGYCLL